MKQQRILTPGEVSLRMAGTETTRQAGLLATRCGIQMRHGSCLQPHYLKCSGDDFCSLAQHRADGVEVLVSDLCIEFLRGIQLQLLRFCREVFPTLPLLLGSELFRREFHIGCQKKGVKNHNLTTGVAGCGRGTVSIRSIPKWLCKSYYLPSFLIFGNTMGTPSILA